MRGTYNLNIWPFRDLGIYNGAIIYEMCVQVNNAMHEPTVNNETGNVSGFWILPLGLQFRQH